MRFNSIRFKVNVLYSAILCLILLVFSVGVYQSLRRVLYQNLDGTLRIKADEIADILRAYEQIQQIERTNPLAAVLGMLEHEGVVQDESVIIDDLWKSTVERLDLKDDYINILNASGRAILTSRNFSASLQALFIQSIPFSTEKVVFSDLGAGQLRFRCISLPVVYHNTHLVIRVATSLGPIAGVLKKELIFMGLAIVGILALTSFIGTIFVRNTLKPVVAITNLANSITDKNLHRRIQEKEPDEEMKLLVSSLNMMIERLEKSFHHINDFSSHVAHELKTPLAIIRGELELALIQERSPEEYKRAVSDCLKEIDRMIRIVKDLLLLSKLDYRPEVFKFETLAFSEFIKEIYEHSKVLASQKEIEVEYRSSPEDMLIHGDKVHLRRLFLNIIHNAVKFAPRGRGRISIEVVKRDSAVHVNIQDNGVGITKDNLPKIFNKFFRADKSEEQTDTGAGLGLSISMAIARAHGGDIRVASDEGRGATFTVILPLALPH